jgi:transcriptional regulator with XRE-family HTH domain
VTSFGQRVAEYRELRDLSQRELGAACNRSESWVSQVERDVLPVNRMSVLQSLADALGVAVADLRPDLFQAREDADQVDALGQLRMALTGHPALGTLFGREVPEPRPLAELAAATAEAWELAHASRFDELSDLLTPLLAELEHAVRSDGRRRRRLAQLLAEAYQAASAAFARQNESDAAWVAADRAIRWAEDAADPLGVVAGHFRMAHACISLNHLDQAEHLAETAIVAMRPTAELIDCDEPTLSMYGAMHLLLAIVNAREGQRHTTQQAIEAARKIASRIGVDRNDYHTEFGPTNVELHAVSTAVDLGDAGEALDVAARVDVSRLSLERQARFLTDVARAHAARRHVGEAVAALLAAELAAPEHVRSHVFVREVVTDLLNLSGRRATPELLELARRIGL